MDIISLEEKITRGTNYTVSLPSLSDEDGNGTYFTRFYGRMRELCERFAASDSVRIRNYKCSYAVRTEGDSMLIEITLSARVKEHSSPPVTVTRKFFDKWKGGILISHSSANSDITQ